MSANDKTFVGNLVRNLTIGDKQEPYTRVSIHVGIQEDGTDLVIVSGDETGLTLNIENEWGTQEMADAILNQIWGWQYQPYSATYAMLDPASELGDGITVGDIYSGIYKRSTEFGNTMLASVSAPSEEEILHELGYEPTTEKKFERAIAAQRAMIAINEGKITAEVNRIAEQGNELEEQVSSLAITSNEVSASVSKKLDVSKASSTFGWQLLADSWSVFADHAEVLKATKDGLTVNGEVRAKSGYIGSDFAGFVISDNAIYRWTKKITDTETGDVTDEDILIWDSEDLDSIIDNTPEEETYGVYIGTDGIRLGANFEVTPYGKVTATSGEFNGTIRCDSLYVRNGDGYESVATSQMVTSLAGGLAVAKAALDAGNEPLKNLHSENINATRGSFVNLAISGNYTVEDPDTGGMTTLRGGITMRENDETVSMKTVHTWSDIGQYISFEDIKDVPEVLGNVAWDNINGKPFTIQSSGETDVVKVTDGKGLTVDGYLSAQGGLSSTGITINTITSNNGQTVSGGTLTANGRITANGGLRIKDGQALSFDGESVSTWDDVRALVSRNEQVVTATWATLSGNPFTTTDGGDGVANTATGGTLQASTLKSSSIFLNNEVITSWSDIGNKVQISYSQIIDPPSQQDPRFNNVGNIVQVADDKLFAVNGSISANGGIAIKTGQPFIFSGATATTWSDMGKQLSYKDLKDKPTSADGTLPWSNISGAPISAGTTAVTVTGSKGLVVNSTVKADSLALGNDSISAWSDIGGKISFNDLMDKPNLSGGDIKWSDITDAPFSYGTGLVTVLGNKNFSVNGTVRANSFMLGSDSISTWSDIGSKISYSDIKDAPTVSAPFTVGQDGDVTVIYPDYYFNANRGMSASTINCTGMLSVGSSLTSVGAISANGGLSIAQGKGLTFNGSTVTTWSALGKQISYNDLKDKPNTSITTLPWTSITGKPFSVGTTNVTVDGSKGLVVYNTVRANSFSIGTDSISRWSDIGKKISYNDLMDKPTISGGSSNDMIYVDDEALGWDTVIRARGVLNLTDHGLQLGSTIFSSWDDVIQTAAANVPAVPPMYTYYMYMRGGHWYVYNPSTGRTYTDPYFSFYSSTEPNSIDN